MHSTGHVGGPVNRLIPSATLCFASAHSALANASPQVSYFVTPVSKSGHMRFAEIGGALFRPDF
jgi:hypothetical protein